MAHRDIIVVGASLGGPDALTRLVSGLTPDLPAAVLIVQHTAPKQRSYLAEILDAAGPLRARPAIDGERLERGRIYVAVPDRHLMVEGDNVRLSRGPKESHARPSVDVLFRSAAHSAGSRVVGIVLTGQLDDGTAGLWAIKDRGGLAIVQSPQEAAYPSMPASALKHVDIDYTLQISDIPRILTSLTREALSGGEETVSDKLQIETRIALDDKAFHREVLRLGKPSFYTCPDCSGSMVLIEEGSIKRFRCHTGHGFSEQALLEQSSIRIEEILFEALAKMEERQALLLELVDRGEGQSGAAEHYRAQIAELDSLQEQLREMTQAAVFTSSSNATETAISRP